MAMHRARQQLERTDRADFIEDVATAVWGGKDASKRIRDLRKR